MRGEEESLNREEKGRRVEGRGGKEALRLLSGCVYALEKGDSPYPNNFGLKFIF